MNKKAKICNARHRGMVGSAVLRRLQAEGYEIILMSSCAEVNLAYEHYRRNLTAGPDCGTLGACG
jgi:GDP-L-fucose synthase